MRIPATILTGFLGAGKSTLVQHMLRAPHGHRIAIIENEFGGENIDAELIATMVDERIVQLTNGCVCCSIRDDLRAALGELASARASGRIVFDRVVIETTGLADPVPVAQTFFLDDEIARDYRPDAIITMVDSKFAMRQLDDRIEAQHQIGFADRLFLTKLDLVAEAEHRALSNRLAAMNNQARQVAVTFGKVALSEMFDIGGFDLVDALEFSADPYGTSCPTCEDGHDCHEHGGQAHPHDDVESFSFRSDRPLRGDRLERLLNALVANYSDRLMRYKGVLHIANADHKLILQGVHQLASHGFGPKWPPGEPRTSKLVFIGRDLPRTMLAQSLERCEV